MYRTDNMYINDGINYIKFLKKKKVIIFGASRGGIKLNHQLKSNQIEVVFFADNDNRKFGKEIDGKKILSPNELKEYVNRNYIIVIASVYENDIKQQLFDMEIFNFISKREIDFGGGAEYYDEYYFETQMKSGTLSGKVGKKLFQEFISNDDIVADFGCGTATILDELQCKEKIGIEINDDARRFIEKERKNIKAYKYTEDIPDETIDVVISRGVLEHVENPLGEIRNIYKKLKDGGRIIFVVPCEHIMQGYKINNFDNHYYSWNCMLIGNLFKAAGYFIRRVEVMPEQWPSNYQYLIPELDSELFYEISEIKGKAWEEYTVRIIAEK